LGVTNITDGALVMVDIVSKYGYLVINNDGIEYVHGNQDAFNSTKDMFKKLTPDFNISTYKKDGIEYLFVDTDWMGSPMRVGDLTMTSCLLYFLKNELICKYPDRFNRENLYFILNRSNHGDVLVRSLPVFLSFFPYIWKDYYNTTINRFVDDNNPANIDNININNVKQILSGGNIWSFKYYLEKNGIQLNIDNRFDYGVVDPRHFAIASNGRKNTYFYPVMEKEYNCERNMTLNEIADIINNEPDDTVTLIIKDLTDIDLMDLNRICKYRFKILSQHYNWSHLFLEIMSKGGKFISGDCGLTHFISMIHPDYRPDMDIRYRTKDFDMKKTLNHFDRFAFDNKNEFGLIDFKPYNPYQKNN
jgi:hypothetical protein